MADFTPVEIEQLRLLLQKQSELLSIADDAAALDVVAGAGQETILDLNEETAATLNLADKTVIDKNDGSATKSLAMSGLVSFVSGQIGGGGTEFNKQGHFKWVAGGGDGGAGYKLNDIVYHNGNTYISTANNNTTIPGAALASWDIFYQNASTSVKGITQLQSTVDDTEKNAATPKAINRRDVHIQTNDYKKGARVQNGFGGGWHEAVQDVPVNTLITNPLFWLPSSNFKIFNSDDVLTTSRALTVNDINKHLVLSGPSNQTFSLPLANSVPSGSMIFVKGRKDFRATFNSQGSDTINIDSGAGFTSCSCRAPESIILVSNGNQDWRLTKINPFYNATAFTAPARAANTNYTNSSPFPIRVIINVSMGGAGSSIVLSGASSHAKPFIILNSNFSIESWFYPGEVYQLSTTGTVTIVSWFEYAVTI